MTPTVLRGLEEIRQHAGRDLGVSSWTEVTQEAVNAYATLASDWDWIHTDPVRAARGPYGRTIAHGFYTLAMLVPLLQQVYRYEDVGFAINYGLDRLRFPAPLLVGSRLRLRAALGQVDDVPADGVQAQIECIFESDATPKPVAVATLLVRYYARAAL
jgi:acyl dehydratase